VAFAPACVQPALDPGIDAACRRLLTRLGAQVVQVPGTGCCGALVHHMGRRDEARAAARRNVAAFRPLLASGRLDAIVVTASGCGTLLKDYGHLLADDADFAEDARRLASLARDVTEVLGPLTRERTPPSGDHAGLAVAYHAACSLQHGQKITGLPETLLRQAGFAVRAIGEGHLCCGSAGTYNLLQPAFATALRDRKVRNIAATGATAVAADNIGCIVQLRGAVGVPIVHTVELLDWAWGGPAPAPFAGAVDHETV
jgi:glycolate oxidase iron-sulfur subunit